MVVVPARQAYSHWASEGRREFFPSFLLNCLQKTSASFRDPISTGRLGCFLEMARIAAHH